MVARTRAGWAARRNGAPPTATSTAAPTPAPAPASTGEAPDARISGAEAVFAAAVAGDPVAVEVVETTGRAIAWGIHLLALAYDVERIVIGGGVSHAGDAFMAPILRELDRYREASPLAAEILLPDLVQLLPADADAGAWGAVTVVRGSLGDRRAAAVGRREVGHA